jgi:hypothetical protein
LSEEYEPSRTDSGRFLAAGAERWFWLRTPAGQLSGAADQVRKIRTQHQNVMVESNSLLELAEPDVFLMVLDFTPGGFQAIERAIPGARGCHCGGGPRHGYAGLGERGARLVGRQAAVPGGAAELCNRPDGGIRFGRASYASTNSGA